MPTIKQLGKEVKELEKKIAFAIKDAKPANLFPEDLDDRYLENVATLKATKRHLEHLKEMRKRIEQIPEYVWVTDDIKTMKGHYQRSPIGIFIKVKEFEKLKAELFGEE